MTSAVLDRCNAYGAETADRFGPRQNLGGFDSQPVLAQFPCPRRPAHRFRWVCEHGHASGEPFGLCEQHYAEFSGLREAPWNVRRRVQFCPRCNITSDHRCELRLVPVS